MKKEVLEKPLKAPYGIKIYFLEASYIDFP